METHLKKCDRQDDAALSNWARPAELLTYVERFPSAPWVLRLFFLQWGSETGDPVREDKSRSVFCEAKDA